MESAASFGPLRPTNFVNFAERGEARPIFGGAGQPFFLRGGAYIPGVQYSIRQRAGTFIVGIL